MKNRSKIIYWVATIWLALGMISTGIVQLIKMEEEAEGFEKLGYPDYLLLLLGVLKITGVVIILIPKLPLIKEWAYAGFFFAMLGAVYSHIMSGSETVELFGPALLLILTLLSWFFRPVGRKIALIGND
ncbi:DoxX family protein [Flavobacterium salilacus subsp. salilacus]|uniref:DoxX family protein n=1 Tax=Flavobacterium TaxID=237 RepID=UPI0010750218|nr:MULTISPECIES: DoxX family protein [Flavobacterium]KAF2519692.1 DoxX family protein [Flavobacterium salilacus subsp. salilacus]MBE1614420.1 DoxX family protein [Flavobacterium sp. SaA2.13]